MIFLEQKMKGRKDEEAKKILEEWNAFTTYRSNTLQCGIWYKTIAFNS